MQPATTREVTLAAGNGSKPPGTRAIRNAVDQSREFGIAKVIGESVALHLAQLLPPLLARASQATGCLFCTFAAKQAQRDYQIAVMNAAQAAEEPPPPPAEPQIATALTWVTITSLAQTPAGPVPVASVVPACFNHVQLPQEPPRQVGLVAADGRPIIASR
jgi:hypothetical protein